MTYRGNYVPKTKKANYKTVVPFIIILAAIIGIIISQVIDRNPKPTLPGYSFCNMSDIQSQKVATASNNEASIAIKDYGIFADTLSFFGDDYSLTENDSFIGKTIFLKNLCGNQGDKVYLLGKGLDEQIAMQSLEPGFYEVRTLNGFNRVRVTSETVIDETTYTSSKDGESLQVRIIGDKDLFNRDGLDPLDKQYVFIEVKRYETPKEQVDIVIDPNGLTTDTTGYVTPGIVVGDLYESNIMYELSEKVVDALNTKGYRARLSRDNKTSINEHGENGRLQKAYNIKAKYYLHLKLIYDTRPATAGASAIYSNFTSNEFARNIISALSATNLPIYDYGIGDKGIVKTGNSDGFDFNAILREAGGKYTGAGTINDTYANLNAFAKGSEHGMHALVLEVGYLSNPQTQTVLTKEMDSVVNALVEGIEHQLNQ